jgi:hypothetical protein
MPAILHRKTRLANLFLRCRMAGGPSRASGKSLRRCSPAARPCRIGIGLACAQPILRNRRLAERADAYPDIDRVTAAPAGLAGLDQTARGGGARGCGLTQLTVRERVGSRDALPDMTVGAAGADLFFVISGFIMVYSSEALFAAPGASRIFFARRLLRIVPLYWAMTLLLIGFYLVIGMDLTKLGISAGSIVASFAFLPYPRISGEMIPVYDLGWTLNCEMFFYAVFACAIVLPRRRAVLCIVFLFAALATLNLMSGPFPQPLAFWCDPLILEFCFGMLIALAYRAGVRLPRRAPAG